MRDTILCSITCDIVLQQLRIITNHSFHVTLECFAVGRHSHVHNVFVDIVRKYFRLK